MASNLHNTIKTKHKLIVKHVLTPHQQYSNIFQPQPFCSSVCFNAAHETGDAETSKVTTPKNSQLSLHNTIKTKQNLVEKAGPTHNKQYTNAWQPLPFCSSDLQAYTAHKHLVSNRPRNLEPVCSKIGSVCCNFLIFI